MACTHHRIIQDGVVRQLEIIGEASCSLSQELIQRHTEVPRSEILGLRNRIDHAYYNIDQGVVWDIVQGDLPSLKRETTHILKEVRDQKGNLSR